MKKAFIGLLGLLIAAFIPTVAGAWSHAGRYGGSESGGGGCWNASGARGASGAGGGGSWSGHTENGGTASGGGGSWSGQSANGSSYNHSTYGNTSTYNSTNTYHATNNYASTTYSSSGTYYGGSYSTYHPPTTVNYYGSSCSNCGGWSTAGAAAAGVAVG